jgi:hypothetical protein
MITTGNRFGFLPVAFRGQFDRGWRQVGFRVSVHLKPPLAFFFSAAFGHWFRGNFSQQKFGDSNSKKPKKMTTKATDPLEVLAKHRRLERKHRRAEKEIADLKAALDKNPPGPPPPSVFFSPPSKPAHGRRIFVGEVGTCLDTGTPFSSPASSGVSRPPPRLCLGFWVAIEASRARHEKAESKRAKQEDPAGGGPRWGLWNDGRGTLSLFGPFLASCYHIGWKTLGVHARAIAHFARCAHRQCAHCGSLPHTPFFFSHKYFYIIFSESMLSIYFIFYQ